MKHSIYFVIPIVLLSCTEEVDIFPQDRAEDEFIPQVINSEIMISADDVESYEDLELYLRGKYGDVQPLGSIWISSGNGDSSSGPFTFRLPNGSEISVDGLYDKVAGQTVDPNFDLLTLPESVPN